MKRVTLVFCLVFSIESMALTTIVDEAVDGKTVVYAHPFLRFRAKSFDINEALIEKMTPGLPAKSQLKEAGFDSYRLMDCQNYPVPFFVVGPDETSVAWLKLHGRHLKALHAMGFITNVETARQIEEMNEVSPVHLIPSNVDGLAEVIRAPSYPFFTNGCEVRQ